MESNKKDVKFILPMNLLGGRENIVKVNNCATRLRLEVKDVNKVNAEEIKKYYPAVQKISDKEVHIVVGTNASELAESLERIMAFDDNASNRAMTLLPLLGNRENIVKVNNCATRLRLEVKDVNKVNTEEIKKYYPAVQKINDKEVHIIVGTSVSELAEDLEKLITSYETNDRDITYANDALMLIPLIGGIENIVKVNNCATRLRLELKDVNKVNADGIKKYYPAVQKINDKEVHIVVGTSVSELAEDLEKLLGSQTLKTSLLLPLVGGIDNITKVTNCATRLRLEIKDINKVNIEEIKKYYPAVETINNNEIHIVVGTDASELAKEFKKFVI
ncbi:phosphoenolpyruvate-dependent sugar phosphotransferase system [Brachyspira intermedia PWS/A]|uniref:Phosphoenolpyruvate-dependent sugar phosphotransferase system n=1 Tax=Brachyspira intermedia (strain ATCC 51140 / PWS/A) TaxID=1045858 RepID=G0EIQ0_BRAIP|nr:PTS transporter subunit EIIB [Brachyspira intermedia]AEM22252.1 phosphoenolpyruvate-dependent sugar phosphotransferase system [Brachyspira intermedia PWS/A]